MIRKYSLVLESGPTGLSGYVPELPSILVTGATADELTARAEEAIKIYWDVLRAERSPTSELREIEVENSGLTCLPAAAPLIVVAAPLKPLTAM